MISYPFENVMFNPHAVHSNYLQFQKRIESTFFENNYDSIKLSNNETISRKKFTPEEDNELIKQAKIFGARKWDLIAKYIPNRTAKQCRDRYKNYLSPNIFHGEWSNEEDLIILEKIKEIGPQWSTIASILRNRTSNSVKNRAKYLIKNKFNPSASLILKDKIESSSDEQSPKNNFFSESNNSNSDTPSDGIDFGKIIDESCESLFDTNFEKTAKLSNSQILFPPIPTEYHVSFQEILA